MADEPKKAIMPDMPKEAGQEEKPKEPVKKDIPVGIDKYADFKKYNYYYADKTNFLYNILARLSGRRKTRRAAPESCRPTRARRCGGLSERRTRR